MAKVCQMSELIIAYLQHLQAGGRAEDTIKLRAGVLARLAEELPYGLDRASTEELAAFLAPFRGWTNYTYYQVIRDYYRWAAGGDDPWLDWDPSAGLIKPRSPRCLPDPVTDEELGLALSRSNEWWTTVILLAAKAGLRAREITALRHEDVTESTIYIRQAKGGDPQTVPTDAELWQRLRGNRGHVVVSGWGRPLRMISNRARVHFDRIGLPEVHLHRFRDWYGTALLNRGANLRTVQECLRHQSVQSTQGYTLVTGQQRRAAVDSLPALIGAPARA